MSGYEAAFQENLLDWCLGGPKPGGWTRTGEAMPVPKVKLAVARRELVPIEQALGKNPMELAKWHISFLRVHGHPFDTDYYREYLAPRMGGIACRARMESFLSLYRSMKSEGFKEQRPLLLADVSGLGMGFDFFRFDGSHRLASACALALKEVPAWIFTLEGRR